MLIIQDAQLLSQNPTYFDMIVKAGFISTFLSLYATEGGKSSASVRQLVVLFSTFLDEGLLPSILPLLHSPSHSSFLSPSPLAEVRKLFVAANGQKMVVDAVAIFGQTDRKILSYALRCCEQLAEDCVTPLHRYSLVSFSSLSSLINTPFSSLLYLSLSLSLHSPSTR